jgi:hypothetical protein
MKSRDLAVLMAVCVALLAGCHATKQLASTGPSHIAPGEVLAHGTIIGAFRIVGGPAQVDGSTPHHPLRGTMTVHSHKATGQVVATTKVPRSGRFRIDVAPGRYVLVGKTPQITGPGGGCPAFHPVTVAAGQTVHIHVFCEVP